MTEYSHSFNGLYQFADPPMAVRSAPTGFVFRSTRSGYPQATSCSGEDAHHGAGNIGARCHRYKRYRDKCQKKEVFRRSDTLLPASTTRHVTQPGPVFVLHRRRRVLATLQCSIDSILTVH